MGALLYLLRGVIAVLGRIAGHLLAGRRDVYNKRRELRVHILVDAWRGIERAANRPGNDEMRGLEQALADIQLFGTPAETEQAARVARLLNETEVETSVLDDLLEVLRVDLREEMCLGRATNRLAYLRVPSSRGGLAPAPVERRLAVVR